jgi:hypothetical protein
LSKKKKVEQVVALFDKKENAAIIITRWAKRMLVKIKIKKELKEK